MPEQTPEPSPQTVYLVDASPYIFRGYFSIPETMTNPAGAPVNAVYGFTQFLLRLIETEHVTHLGLAFDRSLTTSFRNEFFPAYKAQRDLPPPELEAQLDACYEMAQAIGAAVYVDARYEADDLIAALCAQLAQEDVAVVVVTSDKDLAQLVNDRVTLLDFARGERYTPAEVCVRFGVRPAQIADFLGLAGDSVDNIPGVKGVGKKTAAALLAEFDDLETLYADLDRVARLPIRGARTLCERLAAQRDLAFLSRRLATVARDAPAVADLEELRLTGVRSELLEPLLERLGFTGLGERLRR